MSDIDTVTTAADSVIPVVQPTAQLRWRNGVLEQKFVFITNWGYARAHEYEWRPVPIVNDEEAR